MKRKNWPSFFTGMLTAALLFGCMTTALAASGAVSFNRVTLSKDGEVIFSKGEFLETSAGQKIPSSILYTDEQGGGTTYLPVAYISSLFGEPVAWDGETDTVLLGGSLPDETQELLQHLADLWLVDGDYPKTSKGETYGPDTLELLLGYAPDLIAAGATNGAEGYIRRTDMDHVTELMLSGELAPGEPYTVPVYDLEGNVIGEFQFS